MVSALDFQSLILSSIPGGNRSFLLSSHLMAEPSNNFLFTHTIRTHQAHSLNTNARLLMLKTQNVL